jgi:uncharacterized protein
MSVTIDANVLIYASHRGALEHERASDLLAFLADGPGLVVMLWPTVMAYLRVATHPSVFPRPLSHAEAAANIDALLARPHVRAVGEADHFWPTYRATADPVAPRGNLVPDAHVAALMRQEGVTQIWSRDRDLRKFDGIRVTDPFAAKYSDGFGA